MSNETLKNFLDLFVNKDEQGANDTLHSFFKDKMKAILGINSDVVSDNNTPTETTDDKPTK